ncbi:DUF805 domain-containing protein [uncultured Arcticibacterium sp.]|uniref:DUF805 domain-containing protein n=1 Tax=uncultured Arcticibacterium sp. TaxID=2173042 RepID=UPI0030FA22D8
MNYYLDAFRPYFNFEGRARRKAYWMFFLFNMIAVFITTLLDNTLGMTFDGEDVMGRGYIYLLYMLFTFVPNLGMTLRRLHDVGKPGAFILIGLIPLVGAFWLLVLFCTDSQYGENAYGPNPKGKGNSNEDEISEIGKSL